MACPISTMEQNTETVGARSRLASGFAAFFAALALALACAAALPGDALAADGSGEQISVSVPTEVPCALLSDGAVVAPSSWAVSNSGNVPARLSGASASANYSGIDFQASASGAKLLGYSGGSASFDSTLLVAAGGTLPVSWSVSRIDPAAHPDLVSAACDGPVDLLSASFSFRGQASAPVVGVSGSRSYKSTLTAAPAALPDGASVSGCQWLVSDSAAGPWSEVSGADGASLPLGSDLIGKYVKCRLAYSGGSFDVPASESPACGPIAKASASLSVSVSGTAGDGETLTASASGLPSDCTASVSYTWQISSDGKTWSELGAGDSLTLGADLAGKYVRCAATAGDDPLYNVAGGVSSTLGPVKAKTAFAVYSADDNSLDFYKRVDVPADGDTFAGKTATAVYTGIETSRYEYDMAQPWNAYRSAITNATVVDDGISPMSTGEWFYRLYNMTSCDVSKLDTSNVTYMHSMFDSCSSLTSLDLSSLDTSKVTNMSDMFAFCYGFASLDVSHFDTGNVTNMSGMFYRCTALTFLDLSSFDTSNVATMRWMFSNCSSLTSLDVSSFNTSKVKDMNGMFDNCSSLVTLDVSNFDTSKVKDMRDMFSDCTKLASLDVSHFDTSNVTDMYSMFGFCSNLASLDLAGFDTSKVMNMDCMFMTCSSLTSLDLSHFNTANVTSAKSMFFNCSGLSSLDMSGWNTSNVTDMPSMFQGCSSLATLDLSSFDTSRVTDMGWMFYGCSSLASLDMSSFDTSNVSSMKNMFGGCNTLSTVKLGANFKWVGTDGYLPTPSGSYIAGADGKWHADSDGSAYAPSDVPSSVADTYYAVAPTWGGASLAISGDAKVGSTLRASADGVPAWASLSYQWYRDGSAISGATSETYPIVPDDLGHKLTCKATEAAGKISGALESPATASVGKGHLTPSVTLSGTKKNGNTITASVSGLATAGTTALSYKWECSPASDFSRNVTLLHDTGNTHPVSTGAGNYYRCTVTASGNAYYDYDVAVSPAYGPYEKGDASAPTVTVSGGNEWGSTLTATVSGLPPLGTNTVSYQWEVSDDGKTWKNSTLAGNNTASLVVNGEASVGAHYRCRVTVSNDQYDVPVAYSADHGAIVKANQATQPTAEISGDLAYGATLTATCTNPPAGKSVTHRYQWQWCDTYTSDGTQWKNIDGATAQTWKIDGARIGKYIRVLDYVGSEYYNEIICNCAGYGPVAKAKASAPAVTVSGSAVIGGSLTATVSGAPWGSSSYTYQWQYYDAGANSWKNSTMDTAKQQTLKLPIQTDGNNPYGYKYRCMVTTSNNYYEVPAAYSAATGAIGKGTAALSGVLSTYTPAVNNAVKATVSGVPSAGTNKLTYTWAVGDSASAATWTTVKTTANTTATSDSYTPTPAVVGKYLRCTVTGESTYYVLTSCAPTSTAGVAQGNLAAGSAKATLSGTATYGQTLTATASGLPAGAAAKYQWYRGTAAISGATSSTYKLVQADIGQQIKCVVSDASGGYKGTLSTAASNAVAKAKATVSVSISGTPKIDQTMTANVTGLPAGSNTVHYQWAYSQDQKTWTNNGSDASTYKVVYGTGNYYRVTVTVTGNPCYDVTGATSAVFGPFAKADAAAPTVTISGSKTVGGKLTATVSGQPRDTSGTSYQWQYSSDGGKTWKDSGTTGNKTATLTCDTTWLNLQARCVVTTTNNYYNVPTATSAAYGPIGKGSASAPTVTVSGDAVVGGTVKASVSGQPAGTTATSYQWQRADSAGGTYSSISGATGSSYACTASDLNKYLKCVVKTTSSYYNVADGVSAAKGAVGKGTVSASATLGGSAVTGGTLTCSVSGLPSAGTNAVSYQWQWSKDKSSWTNSTYSDGKSNSIKLQGGDVNYYYRCVVTVAGNAYYNVNGATTAASALIGKGNAATPTVTVSGNATYGATLTAAVSGQPSGVTATAYQWQRADSASGAYSNISGATGKTYALGAADMGKYVKCSVVTTSSQWNVPTAVSAAKGAVGKATASTSVSISGTKNNASTLTANVSGLPSVGTNTVAYQWQYSKDGSTGWTNSSYSDGKSKSIKMQPADAGWYYRCVVSVSGNAYYNVNGSTSAAYGPMAVTSWTSLKATVGGSAVVGGKLTASVSGLPTSGSNSLAYQWQYSSDGSTWSNTTISGGATNSITLPTGALNYYYRCVVTLTNPYYSKATATSAATAKCGKGTHGAPTVSISGNKVIENTLTCNVSGQPTGTTSTSYQWQYSSDGKTWSNSTQSDAKSKTFTPNYTWVNQYARCVVTTGNTYYTVAQGASAAYGPFAKKTLSTSLSISGNKAVGSTLTATVSGLPSNGTNNVSYQWARSDSSSGTYSNISGATGKTYTLTTSDYGKYLKCTASVSGNAYYNVNGSSAQGYGSIGKGSASAPSVTISGTKEVGQTLTATVSGQPAGTTATTYQWQRATSASGTYSNISGANGKTYKLTDSDANCYVKCVVGTTSSYYTVPNATSAAYGAIVGYQAFAVYSADDNSLDFYKRTSVPATGSTFNGKTATAVYTGIETGSFTNGEQPWLAYRSAITNVSVSDKGISPASTANWFYSLSNMASCDVAKLDTSKVTNMDAMFYGCSGLTSLDLSSFDTSKATSMAGLFNGCSGLAALDLSHFDTSSVTYMSSMFYGCSGLTSLDLSSFDTSQVTNMSYMFERCSSLTSLDLSSFDTSKVTFMREMFENCRSLASLDLSSFDTSKVTNMYYMFFNCKSLTSLDVSHFDTSKVTNMAEMFDRCSSLTSLDVSHFNTSNATDMGYMFANCTNLTSLDLSSFDVSKVKNVKSMFDDCSRLSVVKLGTKFRWVGSTSLGTGGYLPKPSSSYISGADGKWYALSDGAGYSPNSVPPKKADTYYASKTLRDAAAKSSDEISDESPFAPMSVTAVEGSDGTAAVDNSEGMEDGLTGEGDDAANGGVNGEVDGDVAAGSRGSDGSDAEGSFGDGAAADSVEAGATGAGGDGASELGPDASAAGSAVGSQAFDASSVSPVAETPSPVEVTLRLSGSDGSAVDGPAAVTLSGDSGDVHAVLNKEGAKVSLVPGRYRVSCLPLVLGDGTACAAPDPFSVDVAPDMGSVEISLGAPREIGVADASAAVSAVEKWLSDAGSEVSPSDGDALLHAARGCMAAASGRAAGE